jgi:hypothetical protein
MIMLVRDTLRKAIKRTKEFGISLTVWSLEEKAWNSVRYGSIGAQFQS